MALNRNTKWLLWLISLFALLLIVIIISSGIGVADISPIKIIHIVANRFPFISIEKDWDDSQELALMEWRLPRIAIGAIVGGGLAIAGVVFQALLRNPLSEPYILGVSSGGSLGAVIAIILGIGSIKGIPTLPVFAFLGSLGSIFLVYTIARVGGKTPTHIILLAGVIVNAFFSALIMFLVSIIRENEAYKFILWSMGNLAPSETNLTLFSLGLVVLGEIILLFYGQSFNLLSMGEETATELGVEVERVKKIAFVLASLITGACVAICGIIGFVGLIVPHIVRMIIGADHRILMPTSALVGAIFLVTADTIARTVTAPSEIPVGVVTALAGAPFFIYLLRRKHN
ncbi:TPA: iron ABC transporter permease [Candidatus Poribacteria bacterium]|nr:iron ABC transporter permease [Candidatus Poribacteria bacterium]